MHDARHLDWEGCVNVRDLGGLPTADGHRIVSGAVVRSDSPHRLSVAGWSALHAYGIRTIVDLRHPHERASDVDLVPRPSDVALVQAPLEDADDDDFIARWLPQLGTPHYYRAALDRYPGRSAALVRAVAHARPGGILLHCAIGRDRTGLATLLLLALAGVTPGDIASDHDLSYDRVRPIDPHGAAVGAAAPDRTASHDAAIDELLAGLDVESYLLDAGAEPHDIDAVRRRLLGGR